MPPSLDSCSEGWQALTGPRTPYIPPKALRYREGELIYSTCTDADCDIEAYPIQGGSPRVITTGIAAWDLWVEADQIFSAFDANLWQVPVSGGTPTKLITNNTTVEDEVFIHALTPTSLVWSKMVLDSATNQISDEIWSAPRDGSGAPTLLGNIGQAGVVQQMEVVGDSVLVAGQGPTGAVVPLSGGTPRFLDKAGFRYAGADAQGVYGTTQTGNSFAMHVAPIDGGPSRPFWPTMPLYGVADHIWSDGNGGWFAVVIELFDDAVIHRSAFFIDSQQNATRVACLADPTALDAIDGIPAFTADAAYIVDQEVADPSTAYWQIVRIPRPPAP